MCQLKINDRKHIYLSQITITNNLNPTSIIFYDHLNSRRLKCWFNDNIMYEFDLNEINELIKDAEQNKSINALTIDPTQTFNCIQQKKWQNLH